MANKYFGNHNDNEVIFFDTSFSNGLFILKNFPAANQFLF